MVAVVKKMEKFWAIKQIWSQKKGGLSFTLFRVDRDARNVLKIVFSTVSVFPLRVFLQGKKRFCFRHKVEELPERKKS